MSQRSVTVRPAEAGWPVVDEGPRRWPSLLLAIFLLVVLAVVLGRANGVAEGRLVDTDAYSWVNRVVDLRADGDWFDDTIQRVDPPTGHRQHWSRPFDVLLLAGALAGEPLAGFDAALLAWATVLPCVLGAAMLVVLWWGFADLLDPAGVEALPLLVGLQAIIGDGFMAGRADHRALIGLLLVAVLAISRRAFGPNGSHGAVVAAGVLSGMGLWVGTEFVLVVLVVMMAVGLEWLVRANDVLRRLAVYALSLAGSALVALVLENGPAGSAHARLDELSLVVVVFAGLAALACGAVTAVARHLTTARRRALALATAAAVCAAVLVWAFPALLDGPLGEVDPLYERTRLRHIVELRPLLDGTPRYALRMLVTGMSLVPFALATAVHLWRRRADVFAEQLHLLGVAAAIYLPLAVWQVRWLFALNLVLVVPAALGVQRVMHAAAPRARRVHLGMMAVAAAAALWWLPLLPALREPATATRCDIDTAIAALNDPARVGRTPLRLMAFTDDGPEILFRTPHSVLSIPNHRPQPGFTATYDAMTATAPVVTRRVLDRAGVDAVLVCTDVVERAFYRASSDAFHSRLVDGVPPTWVREVPVHGTRPGFRLYLLERGAHDREPPPDAGPPAAGAVRGSTVAGAAG